jgi:hypothetical protein
MPLAPGTKLGPYEISSLLGAGGMGEVYRGRDIRLDRTVAIKILPAQFSFDPVRKQRFEREAKTISSLNHPHICVLHDVGSQDGVDYLVMECVGDDRMRRRNAPSAREASVMKWGMREKHPPGRVQQRRNRPEVGNWSVWTVNGPQAYGVPISPSRRASRRTLTP